MGDLHFIMGKTLHKRKKYE
jgi:tetratricopeptide (TPR) repeat protein